MFFVLTGELAVDLTSNVRDARPPLEGVMAWGAGLGFVGIAVGMLVAARIALVVVKRQVQRQRVTMCSSRSQPGPPKLNRRSS
jgi:hypothetical protein